MPPAIPGGVGAIGGCVVTVLHPSAPLRERMGNNYGPAPNEEDDDRASLQNPTTSFQVHEGRSLSRNEVNELRDQGITVDDYNEPLPENAQPDTTPDNTPGEWKDLRQCIGEGSTHNNKSEGKWKHHSWPQISLMDELQLWLLCFPVEYIQNVVIKNVNKELETPTDIREFLTVLSCIHFMACYEGISNRREWWSLKPISEEDGAPFRLNQWISWTRFNNITSKMTYTDKDPPDYIDGFHQQSGIEEAYNTHYADN
ncbi:hypothetical protein ACHAWO_010589 [Cyclotella atomus]|uniref:PiggyBac transposable element-derived protein domain-containing protein n=1 Tax=Cyclotella atomus TaxID=382360 RepID=A0ABD3P4B0_9STRA